MRSMQHFTYKYWSTTQTKREVILTTSEKNTKNLTLNPSFFQEEPPPHVFGFPSPAGSSIFFFPQTGTVFLLLLAQTQPAFPVCHPPNTSSEGRPSTPQPPFFFFFPLHRLLLQKQRPATPLCPLVSSSSSSDDPSP